MASHVQLPSNVEAERAVLGSMIAYPESADEAFGYLTEQDFSGVDQRNPLIYKALYQLHIQQRPIDPETVYAMEVDLQLAEACGGNEYIFELVSRAINPDNISYYVQSVHEQAVLRRLLQQCRSIENEFAEGVSNIGDFIIRSNDAITQIAQQRHVQGMRSAKDVAGAVYDRLATSTADANTITGVRTGYRRLDALTHGWRKGDLIILAARPSVGKTAFAMNLAFNAAIYEKAPVAFFSLEMGAEDIMARLIASRALVPNEHIQTGFLSNREKSKVTSAIEEISKTQIYFDDTPNCRLGDIISKAKKLKNLHPDLKLVVIDYLGRIRYSEKTDFNARQQEVSFISGELKTLARNLNVPVICLSQLNRNVEKTENKVPMLSDLRESGAIEQDADVVMLMYRDDYYTNQGISTKPKGWGKKRDNEQQEAPVEEEPKKNNDISNVTISVAKNRNGKVDRFELIFQRNFSRFDDPAPEYEERKAAMMNAGYGGSFED